MSRTPQTEMQGTRLLNKLNSSYAGHINVGNNDFRNRLPEFHEAVDPVRGLKYFEAILFQQAGEQASNRGLVV